MSNEDGASQGTRGTGGEGGERESIAKCCDARPRCDRFPRESSGLRARGDSFFIFSLSLANALLCAHDIGSRSARLSPLFLALIHTRCALGESGFAEAARAYISEF